MGKRWSAGTFVLFVCLLSAPTAQELHARPVPAGYVGFCIATAAADSQRVARRSPSAAMVRSLLIPGWGQWYNGKKWKAALACGAELGLAANAALQNHYLQGASDPQVREYYLHNRNTSNWVLALVVVLSMLDAYVDAHFADFDESPELAARTSLPEYRFALEVLSDVRFSVSVKF